MIEEREQNPDGSTSCGVFIPLPYNLAQHFDDKPEDDSFPHITLLNAGDMSPRDYRDFVNVVRDVAQNVAPFPLDLRDYAEFTNNSGQVIAHMSPGCLGKAILGRIHGMLRCAMNSKGIHVDHTYGKLDKSSLPYSVRFTPHATLAYLDKTDLPYRGSKPTGSWRVTELECWGHEKVRIPLGRTVPDQPTGITKGYLLGRYPKSFADHRLKLAASKVLSKLLRTPIKLESSGYGSMSRQERQDFDDRAQSLRGRMAAHGLRTQTRLAPRQRTRLDSDAIRREIELLRTPLAMIKVTEKLPIRVKPKGGVPKKGPDIRITRKSLGLDDLDESSGGIGIDGSLSYLKYLQDKEFKKPGTKTLKQRGQYHAK